MPRGSASLPFFVQSEVELHHERNILRELWEDSDEPSHFLTDSVGGISIGPPHDTADSPRTEVLNGWSQKGRLGERDSKDEARRRLLLFSTGGRYSASDLRARASMLETLEASLRLIYEDPEVLSREMNAEIQGESGRHHRRRGSRKVDEKPMSQASSLPKQPSRLRRFFSKLGPGLVTGAADDDPSGVATYSIVGAQLGTSMLWTAVLTWPLMGCVQFMCARIGMVTGGGLASALGEETAEIPSHRVHHRPARGQYHQCGRRFIGNVRCS